MRSRAQAAMEYLMTYGWAILVVMVVGIAMWQLGIFNMGTVPTTSTGFAKIKPQLAGTGLSRSGHFLGIFTNGLGTTAVLDSSGATIEELGGGTCSSIAFSPNTIGAGANFKVSASGCATGEPGEAYNLRVSIPYVVEIGGVESAHSESGTIRGAFE